jgi:hypothetical protein
MSMYCAMVRKSTPFLFPLIAALALASDPVSAQDVNALTEAETAAGWQLMFDGKTLAGWHSFKKATISESGWIIKDSSIYLRGPAVGALLAPEKFAFRNFEISIDWKISDAGNSGIFLRYLETEASENIRTGPESQVCGKGHSDYKTGATPTSPGACYAMYAPAKPWIRSAEQFNTFHVIMHENKVAHFGNGERLLEYEIGSADWTAKYEVSKYASFPLYGEVHAGKLFLQDHASPVWYRNIKIRPLAQDPWGDPAFVWPDQGTGIAIGPRNATDRAAMGASPGGWFSLTPGDPGRIHVDLSPAMAWELGLRDAGGHRLAAFKGIGPGSRVLGTSALAPGTYFLTGNAGGRVAKPLRVQPSP